MLLAPVRSQAAAILKFVLVMVQARAQVVTFLSQLAALLHKTWPVAVSY